MPASANNRPPLSAAAGSSLQNRGHTNPAKENPRRRFNHPPLDMDTPKRTNFTGTKRKRDTPSPTRITKTKPNHKPSNKENTPPSCTNCSNTSPTRWARHPVTKLLLCVVCANYYYRHKTDRPIALEAERASQAALFAEIRGGTDAPLKGNSRYTVRCVPCAWMGRACDRGLPCDGCISRMSLCGKEWECCYDPSFTKKAGDEIPEIYRQPGREYLPIDDRKNPRARVKKPPVRPWMKALWWRPSHPRNEDLDPDFACKTYFDFPMRERIWRSNLDWCRENDSGGKHRKTIRFWEDWLAGPELEYYSGVEKIIEASDLSDGLKRILLVANQEGYNPAEKEAMRRAGLLKDKIEE